MRTPRREIANLIAKRTSSPNFKAKQTSREIAAYLLETARTGELQSVLRDVVQVRAEHGIVEVIAVSAFDLEAKAKADIKREVRGRYPNAKQIIITEQHDPGVVAGVRLELPNEQLDLTVRDQLNRFKQLTTAGE